MNTSIIIISMILLIIVFGCSMINMPIEGFSLLNHSAFPCNIDNPILYGDFPVKKNVGITKLENSDIWKDSPIKEVGSYEQITNNVRYWKNPNNGTCTRAELCNSIYDNKTLDIPPHPPILKFGQDIRVNYYNSQINASD
jgi:hypothetical protein